jgi:polyhydroxybutyrate depolymerase
MRDPTNRSVEAHYVKIMTALLICIQLWACSVSNDSKNSSNVNIPDTTRLELNHGGVLRETLVYVPKSYEETGAVPLLLNFHGYGGSAANHLLTSDFRQLAEEQTFLLAYPQGSLLDGSPHWNPSPPSATNKSTVDDFGFIESLVDNLSATYRVDEERVYAVGYSNGAMLAFGLACYRGERIAAIGSVSGTMLTDIGNLCQPPQPTAVITLHGTQDDTLSYYAANNISNPKGNSSGYVSAEDVIEYWVDFNRTQSSPTKETTISSRQTVHSFVYAGGQEGVEVQHYQVIGGEHVWFDLQVAGFGTNELIWNFLSRFRL